MESCPPFAHRVLYLPHSFLPACMHAWVQLLVSWCSRHLEYARAASPGLADDWTAEGATEALTAAAAAYKPLPSIGRSDAEDGIRCVTHACILTQARLHVV